MLGFLHSFWLHMFIAAAIMAMGWHFGIMRQALVFNTTLWPARELWQKRNDLRGFFTRHVTLEWFAPIAVGWLIYGMLQ